MTDNRKYMTSKERDAMQVLVMMDDAILRMGDILKDRCKEMNVKRGSARIGMAKYCVGSLLTDMLETVPTTQLENIAEELKRSSYVIGVRKPQNEKERRNEYGTVVTWAQLDSLIHVISNEVCAYCDKDKKQQRICKLRRVLREIPNDAEECADGSCPYKWL